MKKELDELKAVEKHLAELKKKIEEQTKEDAKVWLKDYISKPFEMKINTEEQTITYFRDGVWIFEQDLKNKKFWYSDYNFYYDFKVKFELNFDETDKDIACSCAVGCRVS